MQKVNCPLCGSSELRFLFKAPADPVEKLGYFSVSKCLVCEFVFTNPQAEEEDLKKLYSSEYYGEEHQRFWPVIEKVINSFRKGRIEKIEKFKKRGRILDIGCGTGRLAFQLNAKCKSIDGIDLLKFSGFKWLVIF